MNHDGHEFIKILSTSNYPACSNRSTDQSLEYPWTLQYLVLFKGRPEMVTKKAFTIHLFSFIKCNWTSGWSELLTQDSSPVHTGMRIISKSGKYSHIFVVSTVAGSKRAKQIGLIVSSFSPINEIHYKKCCGWSFGTMV